MKSLIYLLTLSLLIITPTNIFSQANTDIQKFTAGITKVYSPNNNPKAKGLDFSIKYLQEWQAMEGDRPNIVQKFIKQVGSSVVMYLVIVNIIPDQPIKDSDIDEYFSEIEQTIPKGCVFLSKNPNLKVDGERAALLEYKMHRPAEQNSLGINVVMYTSNYNIIYKNYMIQVQFAVSGSDDNSDLLALYTSYKPLFKLVMNYFVLTSKWK